MFHKILFVGTITPELNIGKLKDFVKKIVYIGVIDLVGHFLIGIPAIFSKLFNLLFPRGPYRRFTLNDNRLLMVQSDSIFDL